MQNANLQICLGQEGCRPCSSCHHHKLPEIELLLVVACVQHSLASSNLHLDPHQAEALLGLQQLVSKLEPDTKLNPVSKSQLYTKLSQSVPTAVRNHHYELEPSKSQSNNTATKHKSSLSPSIARQIQTTSPLDALNEFEPNPSQHQHSTTTTETYMTWCAHHTQNHTS